MENTVHLVTADAPRRFAQIWPSESTGEWVVREGTLGRAGRVRETGLDPATTPLSQLAAPFLDQGFQEVQDGHYEWVVAQFPAATAARDRTLIAHASEWIEATLDESGLGHLDGHDRGKRGDDGKIVVNIFAQVLDGNLGAEAVMAALRAGRADPTRASIGYRVADADIWTVRYERRSGKLPGPFRI